MRSPPPPAKKKKIFRCQILKKALFHDFISRDLENGSRILCRKKKKLRRVRPASSDIHPVLVCLCPFRFDISGKPPPPPPSLEISWDDRQRVLAGPGNASLTSGCTDPICHLSHLPPALHQRKATFYRRPWGPTSASPGPRISAICLCAPGTSSKAVPSPVLTSPLCSPSILLSFVNIVLAPPFSICLVYSVMAPSGRRRSKYACASCKVKKVRFSTQTKQWISVLAYDFK